MTSLAEDELAIIVALHAHKSVERAASELGLDVVGLRFRLAVVAEKLRVASIDSTSPEVHGGGFDVPRREPCPFCRNIDGIASPRAGAPAVVYEDDLVYVFVAPRASGGMVGHTLVITRRHVETILDVTPSEAAALGAAIASAARALSSALHPAGVLIQQNNGVAAFQTVPHIHFHVIPKVPGPFPPAATLECSETERMALAARLQVEWTSSRA